MDFSEEAFDTIEHDKLLKVLYDLGYPADAVEVVKDLYTGTTTTFTMPEGSGITIPVHRGTIQGDSLSPFLFVLYMEPLLRWLHAGGRGYRYGCLQDPVQRHQFMTTNISYADDVNVLTGTVNDLLVQDTKGHGQV